jgi:hypothetical protein
VPSGPTVTASGRQVRSRATGLYGETLHSGQVSDRASPATGDYVRSDVSEEPQEPHAHGRSTRAANKGATNGRPSTRTIVSDDEEDATSWDGGDEDEDEPDQMELDNEEDDQGAESSGEDEEPPTLMVTLRYGKGSSQSSSGPAASSAGMASTNGAPQRPDQQIPAPMEPHLQPAPPSHPVAAFTSAQPPLASNGVPLLPQQAPTVPVVPVAQHLQSQGNPDVLPRLDEMFSVPTQPPSTLADQPAQPQHPFVTEQQQQQHPFVPSLASPAPASTWQ